MIYRYIKINSYNIILHSSEYLVNNEKEKLFSFAHISYIKFYIRIIGYSDNILRNFFTKEINSVKHPCFF